MADPTTREEFKAYILRCLGAPVMRINIDDSQVDDRVDDALRMFWDYHYDGSERVYLAHQVTELDKTNRYLDIDDNIIGVTRIFELSTMLGSTALFSMTYQFAQSDFLASALTGSMLPYWMAMTHIELVQQILIGKQPVRFNRKMNKLFIDMDWDRVETGQYIVIEGFQRVDPETYPEVWRDRWLMQYATQLVKRQWGENLSKYGGARMADGTVLNGDRIWSQADQEIHRLEEEMSMNIATPSLDFMA